MGRGTRDLCTAAAMAPATRSRAYLRLRRLLFRRVAAHVGVAPRGLRGFGRLAVGSIEAESCNEGLIFQNFFKIYKMVTPSHRSKQVIST